MENHTFDFKMALQGTHTSAQWYIEKANKFRRELIESKIDAELSGCWRCSGREKGICSCCDHKAAADRLEKML